MNFFLQGPNIVNKNATPDDIKYLFGDMDENIESVVVMETDCLDWSDVAVHCEFFPSKSQARKNGWVGLVPQGFGQRKFGKTGKGVWFYNPPPEWPSL
jgi:hypothetical protein